MTTTTTPKAPLYAIWREANYLRGTCHAPESGWVWRETASGSARWEFSTREAAEAAAEEMRGRRDGPVHLAHGQYAADSFVVKRVRRPMKRPL